MKPRDAPAFYKACARAEGKSPETIGWMEELARCLGAYLGEDPKVDATTCDVEEFTRCCHLVRSTQRRHCHVVLPQDLCGWTKGRTEVIPSSSPDSRPTSRLLQQSIQQPPRYSHTLPTGNEAATTPSSNAQEHRLLRPAMQWQSTHRLKQESRLDDYSDNAFVTSLVLVHTIVDKTGRSVLYIRSQLRGGGAP
jgi:hypothetical protein